LPGRANDSDIKGFLDDLDLRPLNLEGISDLEPAGLAIGRGSGGLEIAVTRARSRPTQGTMRKAWAARRGGRAVPVLLVALYRDHAAICGPGGEQPPVYFDLDQEQAERICLAALDEPNRHAAMRMLHAVLPEVKEASIPGIYNEGLFATHELLNGVPARPDWQKAGEAAGPLLRKQGRRLLEALGYQVSDTRQQYSVLRAAQSKVAVAIFLDRSEATDAASERFGGMTPIQYALAKADEENLDYVIVDHGASLRLYTAGSGRGVGHRGRTETFIEAHLTLIPPDKAGYLWLLFSGEALGKGGSFDDILDRSHDYSADLGARLRERIYGHVIPLLSVAIARARSLTDVGPRELAETYEMALTVLFRLLFIAYAEDKNLLPYRDSELYRARSLKQKARELAELKGRGEDSFDDSTSHWDEVAMLFNVVNDGKPREWGVPAYNGGLFASDPEVSPTGALIAGIQLPNSSFAPALTHLLVDETPEGAGPVDFRSLGVREFGTIYEGLLESELSVAQTPLAIDGDGFYVPVAEEEEAEVAAGEFYLHDVSGKRKSSGSYYTKAFAVEHLLDHSLEPALDDHIKRLNEMDDRSAAKAFFDFRVADIAMGSGHFLVAAVDRIERRLSRYLVARPLADVTAELRRLRRSALEGLEAAGGSAEGVDIDNDQLLRRQIARRSVYGVDINPVAVQLARLSLWIHTFVPGLPLSFLDHNIVCGNSLVGIATMEEAAVLLGSDQGSFEAELSGQFLAPVKEKMERLAKLSDADASQIDEARELLRAARETISEQEIVLDILTASRLPDMGYEPTLADLEDEKTRNVRLAEARELLRESPPFHFPVAFPEVFLRERAGFDVVIGNPPWEEATLEEDDFWSRYVAGFQALPQREQEKIKRRWRKERPDLVEQYKQEVEEAEAFRRLLTSGPYPGMGTGDPDLYKAFCWRFWQLACIDGGRIGVVLPRSVWSVKGSSRYRKTIFYEGLVEDFTYLLNKGGWVFEDAHPQYTITLSALQKVPTHWEKPIPVRGPFSNLARFRAGTAMPPVEFPLDGVLSWTDTAALPLLPSEESAAVFMQLRKAPRLDLDEKGQWRARPYRELDATNDKELIDLTADRSADGYWPVYKGESFDIWENDRGVYYGWADPETMLPHLRDKRIRSRKNRRSPFSELVADHSPEWFADEETLPCMAPRVAFRDVTNRTNQRTVIAALIPPRVFITNKGPFFLWPRGDEHDQAFLLGLLCSVPLDWYARRFVETGLNFHIINPFPIPRSDRSDPLWQRVVQHAGRLACPDERFADWARAVGVKYGSLEQAEKDDMIYELDAVVAHLYGLSEAQLRHIFETFHEGWDCEPRLSAVMEHYRSWGNKL